jgi:hypothetical protein
MRKTFLALLLSGVLAPAMVRAETADAGTPDDGPPPAHSAHALAENDDSDSSANMPPPNAKDAAHERYSSPPETGAQGSDGSNKANSDTSDADKSRKNTAPPAQNPARTPATSPGSRGGSSGTP